MKKAACIGGGVIGGGWAARFLLNGWDVSIHDPSPAAHRKVHEVLTNARRSLPSLYDRALPDEGKLTFHQTIAEAVSGAGWIQESVPEQPDLKHKILSGIQNHALPDAILGSSTSGFKPSDLQKGAVRPGQIIVAHPFNPVYLLPLVEIVASAITPSATVRRAAGILTSIGMKPLLVRKEIDAHIADRLLEAVWREGLWLINDGIATTAEIDDSIRYGFGLRWAQMGLFETYRIAGGEAGMKHFIEQFGPALKWPWTRLMEVPELTETLTQKIASQSDAQSGHLSIREMERLRDDNLVGILRALRGSDSGAGGTLNRHEKTLPQPGSDGNKDRNAGPGQSLDIDTAELPLTVVRQVPQSWADQNGFIFEAGFHAASTQATDRFMELIGTGSTSVASGHRYVTLETRIRFLGQLKQGQTLTVTTQVIAAQDRHIHLVHRLSGPADNLVATSETMLVHMDLKNRKPSLPPVEVTDRLAAYAKAHAHMPAPENAGLCTGQKP